MRLWGKNFAQFVRQLRDEDYSIAMLVFSVLFCGLHPYATRNGAETLREEIINHNFPYNFENDNEFIPIGGYDHIWEYLSDRLRKMLYETFRNGISYEALEWLDAVVKYKEELENFVYDDPEAYKVFPCENYNQVSVDVEEGRAAIQREIEKKQNRVQAHVQPIRQQSEEADEPEQTAEVSPVSSRQSVGSDGVPEAFGKPIFEKKAFANAPTGKYVPKDHLPGQEEEMEKRKKFFGLF